MLTDFQHHQLLSLHFEGQFQYRNEAGNRWPRVAWVKMIDRLSQLGYIDTHCQITSAGEKYLEAKELPVLSCDCNGF